jgi:hypothetical protein
MIALGFFNRFRLAPRLAPGASALAPLRNEVALKDRRGRPGQRVRAARSAVKNVPDQG